MPNRDQNWGFGGGRDEARGRRDEDRRLSERGGERRSFGGEPWEGEDRYGARYDQDRTGYGGQEYGLEGGSSHRRYGGGYEAREGRRPDRGAASGDLMFSARNRGRPEHEAPQDYAYHPREGHEFDPDYLAWREAQMRNHDRDYREWRQGQQQAYDEDYHRYRHERRQSFHRSFSDWRNQRSMVGGVADTTVAPGVGGYGDKVGQPSGYDYGAASRPSGTIERPEAINASPAAAQTGGDPHHGHAPQAGRGGDSSPEFGKEPPQVQAASDGWDGRGSASDRAEAAREDHRDEQR